MEGYRRKSLIVKTERNGAPKGMILELFLTNSCQACHGMSFPLGDSRQLFGNN